MGLTELALDYLDKFAKRENKCEHCGRFDGYVTKEIGTYGMFDELSLCRYYLTNERIADEYVQHCVWSSGPMEWLGLRVYEQSAPNEVVLDFTWDENQLEY